MATHRSDLVGVMIRPRDGCNEVKPAASSNNPGRFCPLEPLMGANWAKWDPFASGANFLNSVWVVGVEWGRPSAAVHNGPSGHLRRSATARPNGLRNRLRFLRTR